MWDPIDVPLLDYDQGYLVGFEVAQETLVLLVVFFILLDHALVAIIPILKHL